MFTHQTFLAGPAIRAVAALVLALGGAAPGRLAAQQAPAPRSGSLTGVVVDSSTGAPVAAAQVRIEALHRVELTHDDGAFHFEDLPAGLHTLTVRRIGYRARTVTARVPPEGRERLRVAMEAAAIELSRTVVTGTLDERPGEEVLSPTSVLSGAELDRRLGGTLAQTLETQPGVAVTAIGPSTARPVIRGLGGDRIVVLEDGQRPGDLSAMSGDHAVTIDPASAEQIEVVRGPMSLLYGSSALGGVVNVVREEIPATIPDRVHGSLVVQGTTVNEGASVAGHARAALGRLVVRGEASARGAGNTRTPVGELTNTGVAAYALSAGGATVGDWGHAGAAYRYYANDYGIPGGFVGGHEQGVDIQMRRHTVRAEADVHPRGGAFDNVRATATVTDYAHTEFEPSGAVGTRFDQTLWSGEAIARHGASGPLAMGALGIRGQHRDLRTGGSLNTPSTYDYALAAFAVEEVGRGPLRLQAGVRYDWAHYEPRERTFIDVGGERVPVRPRTFGAVSGSLGAIYEAAAGVRLGASVARAYRTPDLTELYSNGPHLAANSFNVGDPNLKEETGLGIDAFVRVSRATVNAELSAFWNRLDDFIFESSRGRAELGSQGGVPRFQYTNEGADFTGAEGRVEWSVSRRVVVDATLSYVRARFTSARDSIPVFGPTDTTFVAASEFPPLIPPANGRAGVRYDRTRWFAGASVRFAGRQERLGDFEAPTAGYAVADLAAGIRLVRGSQLHTLTLRVDNLLDHEYRDHLSRIKVIMPEPGRNVGLLYRLTF